MRLDGVSLKEPGLRKEDFIKKIAATATRRIRTVTAGFEILEGAFEFFLFIIFFILYEIKAEKQTFSMTYFRECLINSNE